MTRSLHYEIGDDVTRELASADPLLGLVIQRVETVSTEPPSSLFAALARIILGQQLSESAARAIISRVERDVGLAPEAISEASDAALRDAGVSGRKREYLRGIAESVQSGELDLTALETLDDDSVVARLVSVRGVGRWTAQMYLIFALGRPDVVVVDDVGIREAAGRMLGLGRPATPSELEDTARRWKPHRSAGTLFLYHDRAQSGVERDVSQ